MNARNNCANYENYERISFSNNENNNSNRKLKLPIISKEYFPSQKNIKLFNKFLKDKNSNLKSTEIKKKIFLTSPKDEESEKEYEKNNNIFTKTNNEKKIIRKILYDNIIINNFLLKENKSKLFQRNIILKKYMNEAILYRKSIFQRKKINVGEIFNNPISYDKTNEIFEDLNHNKKTIDTSINSNLIEGPKKMKKFKTLDRNIVLSKSVGFSKPNKNKLNCNLKYNFNKNQKRINEINSILNNIEEETKVTFDGYRNQIYKIIDKAKPKKE